MIWNSNRVTRFLFGQKSAAPGAGPCRRPPAPMDVRQRTHLPTANLTRRLLRKEGRARVRLERCVRSLHVQCGLGGIGSHSVSHGCLIGCIGTESRPIRHSTRRTAGDWKLERLFSTHDVHPRERFAYWHDVACKTLVNHHSKPHGQQPFHAHLEAGSLADIGLVQFETSALTVHRTQRHVALAG